MPDVERQIFSHILVPLDGSAEANIAVAQACTLAASSGATITLVRVVSSAKEVTDAEAFLEDIARQYATSNQRIETVARDGDAASAIVEEIRRRGADLVVMRTRGRSGLTRAVLGSVAEQMVKNSPTPVWLLPPGVRAARALESILVPVDGSPGGSLALGIARELAAHSGTGTRLSLLQVVVPMPLYFGHDVMHGPVYVDPYWDEVAQTTAREYVTSIATQLGKTGIRAQGDVVANSSVPDAIVNAAAQNGADLIVMSSEAHTGATRVLLGSVTDAVVRSATCPILVIRRPPDLGHEAESTASATTTQ